MMIRRLDPDTDLELYGEMYSWEMDAPQWFREASGVDRPTWEDFLTQIRDVNQIDIGVWSNRDTLCAVVSVTDRGSGSFEGHLWAKRHTKLETITMAVWQVMDDLFQRGMNEAFVVVAEKNRAVIRMCQALHMIADGQTKIGGEYHGRPIKWIKLCCTRDMWVRLHEKVA